MPDPSGAICTRGVWHLWCTVIYLKSMRKLEEELNKLAKSDAYPFHMPGHKRRDADPSGGPLCAARAWDITEIDGFDNLHDPSDLLREEMERAARFYGTKETYFLVNGSTCGMLAAVSAAVPRGGRILMERGCHISVYHAVYMMQLEVLYIEDFGAAGDWKAFENAAPFDAVVITSPTYEGLVKDVRFWSDFAHANDAALIVDEAHGAHFSLHPYFPESAVRQGADLVVQSLHKTLPSLTSTALLHNVSGRVSFSKIKRFLDIYETSSPSYLLLASITSLMHELEESGSRYFDDYVQRLQLLRGKLAGSEFIGLAGGADACLSFDGELPGGRQGMLTDPGKIVLTGADGAELYDLLRLEYGLQPEMKGPDYVLMMTSPADSDEGFERLLRAVSEIVHQRCQTPVVQVHQRCQAPVVQLHQRCQTPVVQMKISEAMDAETEMVAADAAVGRIAADFVIQYPPDVPLLAPGEVITEDLINEIRQLKKAGFTITGFVDDQFLCVKAR